MRSEEKKKKKKADVFCLGMCSEVFDFTVISAETSGIGFHVLLGDICEFKEIINSLMRWTVKTKGKVKHSYVLPCQSDTVYGKGK